MGIPTGSTVIAKGETLGDAIMMIRAPKGRTEGVFTLQSHTYLSSCEIPYFANNLRYSFLNEMVR